MKDYTEILKFWFEELGPSQRFAKDDDLDQKIRERYLQTFQEVLAGMGKGWRKEAEGRLAEIIVLDQFPRNMFRETPAAFATDPLALELAQEAVRTGVDRSLDSEKKAFLYMPYMHSEDLEVHKKAVELFSQKGLESNLQYEIRHKKIIERFGRYPHRNSILGRKSTPEELEFLKEKGSSF